MITFADICTDDIVTIQDELGNRAEGRVIIEHGRSPMMLIKAFDTKINIARMRGDSWVRASKHIKVISHQAALDFS